MAAPLRSALRGGRYAAQQGRSQLFDYGSSATSSRAPTTLASTFSDSFNSAPSSFRSSGYPSSISSNPALSLPSFQQRYPSPFTRPSIPTSRPVWTDTHATTSQGSSFNSLSNASSSYLPTRSSSVSPWRFPLASTLTTSPQTSTTSASTLRSTFDPTLTSSREPRSNSADTRRHRPERRTGSAPTILKTSSPTTAGYAASLMTHSKASLHVRSRLVHPESKFERLSAINSAWYSNYSNIRGKSTRLSFAPGSQDDRGMIRTWRKGFHLDTDIGSLVEASSIAAYRTRTLTSALDVARRQGMNTSQAEKYLRDTLDTLRQTTYMTRSEVRENYAKRMIYKSTDDAQSRYHAAMRTTDEDGKNPEYKKFLYFMRETERMIDDKVVQVDHRDGDEDVDSQSSGEAESILEEYMDKFSALSSGASTTADRRRRR